MPITKDTRIVKDNVANYTKNWEGSNIKYDNFGDIDHKTVYLNITGVEITVKIIIQVSSG